MRLYYSIKFFFKSLKSNLFMNICSFILLPMIMLFFMDNISKNQFESPNITSVISINIIDNDNSSSSKQFIDYIKNNCSELFNISNKNNDSELEITIPEGYESSLLTNNKSTIEIKELQKISSRYSNIAKNIIDNYHQQLYFNDVGTSFIENKFIDANISQTSSQYYAITFVGFLVISFIFNNIASTHIGEVSNSYVDESSGLNKRIYSMPISRVYRLILNFINLFLYSLIFLVLYLLVNRFLGIAFTENIFILIILSIITSLFVASASKFIDVFLPKKYGVTIVSILFLGQMVFGGMFTPFVDSLSKLYKISPVYIIIDLFNKYSIYNNIDSILKSSILILLISLVLFILSVIKEKYSWKEI